MRECLWLPGPFLQTSYFGCGHPPLSVVTAPRLSWKENRPPLPCSPSTWFTRAGSALLQEWTRDLGLANQNLHPCPAPVIGSGEPIRFRETIEGWGSEGSLGPAGAFILHAGGLETEQVRGAQTAGQAWGPALLDPSNHAPRCPASASGVCCCCLFLVTRANKVFFLLFKPPVHLSCICLMQPEMCHCCSHHVPHPAIQEISQSPTQHVSVPSVCMGHRPEWLV